ncbi:RES family NAD+ phosphorylase [Sorangium sp. So ce1014]|uniref:RES family NAD+ phosphorylase n=1 Tax=Sorangium sp. So ce1014 TaxID=3133326 RepID=UPI003F6026BB
MLKTKFAHDAFSGEGARLYGGRWNSPGTAMVYLGESLSLCALEVLVHLQATAPLDAYSLIRVDFDSSYLTDVDQGTLPPGWADSPPPAEVQQIGDGWVAGTAGLLLRVPSAILPAENNILLNPKHPAFGTLRISAPVPFRFDPRLFR